MSAVIDTLLKTLAKETRENDRTLRREKESKAELLAKYAKAAGELAGLRHALEAADGMLDEERRTNEILRSQVRRLRTELESERTLRQRAEERELRRAEETEAQLQQHDEDANRRVEEAHEHHREEIDAIADERDRWRQEAQLNASWAEARKDMLEQRPER